MKCCRYHHYSCWLSEDDVPPVPCCESCPTVALRNDARTFTARAAGLYEWRDGEFVLKRPAGCEAPFCKCTIGHLRCSEPSVDDGLH